MKLILFCLSIVFFGSSLIGQTASRSIVSSPSFQPPAEAVESGLGGKVNVEVEVDKAGEVASVKNIYGPDWVCPTNKRRDVLAIRETARSLAKEIKFAPAENGSTEWIGITFPSEQPEAKENATGSSDSSSGGVTSNGYDPARSRSTAAS